MTATGVPNPLVVDVPEGVELAVSVRGLRKSYGETRAADGVNLDVIRGEVLALLGPNGAGKTTTTEILPCLFRKAANKTKKHCSEPPLLGTTRE